MKDVSGVNPMKKGVHLFYEGRKSNRDARKRPSFRL